MNKEKGKVEIDVGKMVGGGGRGGDGGRMHEE